MRITVPDFADQIGVSATAIFNKINQRKKYQHLLKDLGDDGHPHVYRVPIGKDKTITYLDEIAMAELDSKSQNHSIDQSEQKSEEVEILKSELKDLNQKYDEVNKQIEDLRMVATDQSKQIKELMTENSQFKSQMIEILDTTNKLSIKYGFSPLTIDSKKYPALPSGSFSVKPVDIEAIEVSDVSTNPDDIDDNNSLSNDEPSDNSDIVDNVVTEEEVTENDGQNISDSNYDETDSIKESERGDLESGGEEEAADAQTDNDEPTNNIEVKDEPSNEKLIAIENLKGQIAKKKEELSILEQGFHPFKRRTKQGEINSLTDLLLELLADFKQPE